MQKLSTGIGAALTIWSGGAAAQTYDPLLGPPPAAAARPTPPAASAPAEARKQRGAHPSPTYSYGPLGWQETGREPPDAPSPPVTKLLSQEDGRPLYEPAPVSAIPSPATASRLLPVRLDTGLPLGAGLGSPRLPGGRRFLHHYLIDFWRSWPDAKVRGKAEAPETLPGYAPADLSSAFVDNQGVPKDVEAKLRRQADVAYQALLKLPVVTRRQGFMVEPQIEMFVTPNIMGTKVYGWLLRVQFTALDGPLQPAGGRWKTKAFGDHPGLEICSNCAVPRRRPLGAYNGLQVLVSRRRHVTSTEELNAMVTSGGRPTSIANGGAEEVANPDFYDPARSMSDIQMLLVQPIPGTKENRDAAFTGALAPDTIYGRAVAATFLVDWKGVVNQINGPGAPPAQ